MKNLIKHLIRVKLNEDRFKDAALDKLNIVGTFDKLPDIDKLALLGGTNDPRLKALDLLKVYKENGGTFGRLNLKVRVKHESEQPIDHRFSKEHAGKMGYLYPYIFYDEVTKTPYVNVRFKDFTSNLSNYGGGNYDEAPIALANLIPLDYNEIDSDFDKHDKKAGFERDEFKKHFGL